MKHQKIDISCIYLLVYGIVVCNNVHNRDGTLKTKLEKFYINILNSDFSIKIFSISAKFLRNVVYSLPEGSVLQTFDLGPGYFLYLM